MRTTTVEPKQLRELLLAVAAAKSIAELDRALSRHLLTLAPARTETAVLMFGIANSTASVLRASTGTDGAEFRLGLDGADLDGQPALDAARMFNVSLAGDDDMCAQLAMAATVRGGFWAGGVLRELLAVWRWAALMVTGEMPA